MWRLAGCNVQFESIVSCCNNKVSLPVRPNYCIMYDLGRMYSPFKGAFQLELLFQWVEEHMMFNVINMSYEALLFSIQGYSTSHSYVLVSLSITYPPLSVINHGLVEYAREEGCVKVILVQNVEAQGHLCV